MAKESMKAREVKRAKTVAKYSEKRKALKAVHLWALLITTSIGKLWKTKNRISVSRLFSSTDSGQAKA